MDDPRIFQVAFISRPAAEAIWRLGDLYRFTIRGRYLYAIERDEEDLSSLVKYEILENPLEG